MSLFVCSKCGCIDNTATSYYWALIRPCKNRIYDKSLKGYEGRTIVFRRSILTKKQNNMGFKIKKSITYDMMNSSRVEYEFDNTNDLNHIIFKGNCREPFSFSRVLVEELIKTFETIRDRYSDNYELKVYLYNCIIQLSVNPKDPSESFFGVYDRDEMKLIYGIKISILKGMFGI